MRRIGELAVEAGLITATQLEVGLRAQALQGARLGTNLIESFGISLDALAVLLAEQHGLRAAVQQDFDEAEPAIQDGLSPELAARWMCIALNVVTDGQGSRILVAARDPLPPQAVDAVSVALGVGIEVAIAPELRIFYHLEADYGFVRPNRFKRIRKDDSIELPIFVEDDDDLGEDTLDREPTGQHPRERRRFVSTLSDLDEDAEPSREILARIPIRRGSANFIAERDLTVDPGDVDDAVRSIKRATGRDAIGDLITDVLRQGFDGALDAGMVLVIREGLAVGWKGFVRGGLDDLIELVAIPLNEPSSVGAVYELGTTYVGPPMQNSPIERRLWAVLEVLEPAEIGLVPVSLHGTIVCLVFALSKAPGGIGAGKAEDLRALGAAMAAAFERLTRAQER
ncbi:MAG TPA: hypothetical protein VML75_20815 [Kofleriaceae bacterium]|nr:hypothetical protein [Kofleriaceae bacterium]